MYAMNGPAKKKDDRTSSLHLLHHQTLANQGFTYLQTETLNEVLLLH